MPLSKPSRIAHCRDRPTVVRPVSQSVINEDLRAQKRRQLARNDFMSEGQSPERGNDGDPVLGAGTVDLPAVLKREEGEEREERESSSVRSNVASASEAIQFKVVSSPHEHSRLYCMSPAQHQAGRFFFRRLPFLPEPAATPCPPESLLLLAWLFLAATDVYPVQPTSS